MAISSIGLQTHIWNNNFKSVLLLAGYPLLLLLMIFAFGAFSAGGGDPVEMGMQTVYRYGIWAFIGAGIWFFVAFLFHQSMINHATGAQPVSRKEAPEIYNMMENLCISRGMTMPSLNIIDTPVLNAYASGISDKSYAVTLTRGIIERLNAEELEAVIGHELSHIRHKDVRLLIISVIFVGMFSFFAEMAFRSMMYGRPSYYQSDREGRGRGAGIIIAMLILAVGYVLAIVIRFALSRKREYLADAGSVELTKNPSALISALRKISGNSRMEDTPAEVQQMFIENDMSFMGLFATHPPMEKRIAALVALGGNDMELPSPEAGHGPWG